MSGRVTGAAPPGTRLPWVDAARAVLVLLGIPFHAAFVYRGLPWYSDSSAGPLVAAFAGFVHTFRMPAFFAIAGYFAVRAAERKPLGQWTAERARQLLVPFAVGVVLLGPAQLWLIARTTGPGDGTMRRWAGLLAQPSLWVFQLWFLVVLFGYGLVLAAAVAWFGRVRARAALSRAAGWATAGGWQVTVTAAGAALFASAGWAVTVFAEVDNVLFGLVNVRQALIYAPSFVLGAATAVRPDLAARAVRCSPLAGLCWCVAAGVTAAVETMGGAAALSAYHAAVPVVGAGMTAVLLTLVRRYAARPRRITAHLAGAAMTVYVFHNVLLLGFASLLLPVGWPAPVEYVVLVGAALAGALSIHSLVVRVPVLSLLFHGRAPRRRARPETVAGHGAAVSARSHGACDR
ncbi:acyltransferase family protein [Nocardia sp. IBHARD005]|uniref:acyltransferase family protein n=1 Tax=Nocardia sp. IBHARD005 TaxID=3457765 RepID=UPI004059620E